MEVKLTGPKILRLHSSAVAYILDRLAECPFKDVNGLINEIFNQLRQQEDSGNVEVKNDMVQRADGAGGSGADDVPLHPGG